MYEKLQEEFAVRPVISGFLIQFCIGSFFIWSLWVSYLEDSFNCGRAATSSPFMIASLILGFSGLVMGWFIKRYGPRVSVFLSTFLMGIGFLLSSLTSSIFQINLSFGVIYGVGLALGSFTSITLGVIHPIKKGIATGIIVSGFGIGAVILAILSKEILNFASWRVNFFIIGILFLIVCMVCTLLIKNLKINEFKSRHSDKILDYSPLKMLKTTRFILIWSSFFCAFTNGLLAASHLQPISTEFLNSILFTDILGIIFLAIASIFGRLITGYFLDLIGIKFVCMLHLLSLFAIGLLSIVTISKLSYIIITTFFYLSTLLIGLTYGGFIVSLPVIVAIYFGEKNVSINYGIAFTSLGLASLIGSYLAGYTYEFTQSYSFIIRICLSLSLLGFLMFIRVFRLERKE
ncbi:MAG: MFS transporter [Archaeoglobus sp.]|nr:MFS transporter [Archaeoglobus sp.]